MPIFFVLIFAVVTVRKLKKPSCPNVSITPLRQWGFRQCFPFIWTTLRGKHCRHPIAVIGVVDTFGHGLRTLREEIAFTARPKIHSHSQIFRYCRSIFCLLHRPNFSDIFDLCLHWVSVVRDLTIT